MPVDDEGDGSPFEGGPLPPEDRLWRHPSEVGAATAAPSRRSWLPAATALGGAAVAVAVLAASGALSQDTAPSDAVIERVATPSVATVPVVAGASEPTDGATPEPQVDQVVAVEAGDEATGSGVILRSDGHVVTSAALVADDEQVLLVATDGRRGPASVVGTDPLSGVAVLAASWLAELPGAVFGRSDELRIGDQVTAIGPDAEGSRTGVVSDVSASAEFDGRPVHGLLRTTTALAPDGAGGAIVNRAGHVVAITLWGDPSPATWSVPVDVARRVADDLIDEGRARHAWLGVEGEDDGERPRLVGVVEGSPAAEAGLEAGDVLLTVGDRPVAAMADVVLAVRGQRPGDEVEIEYERDGEPQQCTAVLTERS